MPSVGKLNGEVTVGARAEVPAGGCGVDAETVAESEWETESEAESDGPDRDSSYVGTGSKGITSCGSSAGFEPLSLSLLFPMTNK